MPDFRDTSLPVEARIQALLAAMTVEEKLSQVNYRNAAVPRLGILPYVWWNEALHGLARSGAATVFPQAIAMAATFNPDALIRMGRVIALEGRARHHESLRHGDHGTYKGLTYWSPNINIFRDPRWGRGHETYGECPVLTATMGVAYVKGVQGDNPNHLHAAACAKHYAVHSGPEATRGHFNAVVGEQDLRETYLPAFEACVRAGVAQVMSAYNAVNGTPASANRRLLVDILRGEWGFDGAVVSDAGAGELLYKEHKVTRDYPESTALEVKNGVDCLTDGDQGIAEAFRRGLVNETDIDAVLANQLRVKFRLGMFDPPAKVPLADTPYDVVECDEHRRLALDAARQCMTLLKNDGLLPLDRAKLKSIAVIGPNADSREILLGNYNGTPTRHVTPLEGILDAVAAAPGIRVWHARGCENLGARTEPCAEDRDRLAEAVAVAQRADVAVLFMGLTPRIEGEAGDAFNSEAAGDKVALELPGIQNELIQKIVATGKPVVLVLISGSALAPVEAVSKVNAVLQGWYPGAEGGAAIAETLFGDLNPAGRLPVTFYRATSDLPPFDNYDMTNRTYRFFTGTPLFPFGFGLSYTRFEYRDLSVAVGSAPGEPLRARVTVANVGRRAGDEVVQAYVTDLEGSVRRPIRQLAAFTRLHLKPGESRTVTLDIPRDRLAVTDTAGRRFLEPGRFSLHVGGSQPDPRSVELTGARPLETTFDLT